MHSLERLTEKIIRTKLPETVIFKGLVLRLLGDNHAIGEFNREIKEKIQYYLATITWLFLYIPVDRCISRESFK